MNVTPIANPLTGEHLVSVSPPMQPDANLGWNRRLNLFTGRALSDQALTTEQQGRAGQLALRGQMVSPGVVQGLEVVLEPGNPSYYQITAGMGIAASGEDVLVPRNLRIAVGDVRVHARVTILDGTETDAPDPEGTPVSNPFPRRLGGTLQALIDSGVATNLSRAGMLLLQPIAVDQIGRGDPRDPCEIDPQNDAYADWQTVDGCRLIWYAWPTETLPLPEPGDLTDGVERDRWRNRLAYTIFNAEINRPADQQLPWEELGVPIALVGFDASWQPVFVDRYSVVRSGGKPRSRTPLVPGTGNPFLWQARIQQFAEQVAELDLNTIPIQEVANRFFYLPPLGLLPKTAVDVRGVQTTSAGKDHFFPASYRLRATPVPIEQLDVVMQASASLVPYTLGNADQVQILVPVPQIWYDPDLLEREAVDPLFQSTIDEYGLRRAAWLNRREIVRNRRNLIVQSITGTPPTAPSPDPDRLEDELDQPPVPFSSTRAHQSSLVAGSHQHFFDGATPPFGITTGDRLTTYIYLDPDNLPEQVMLQWRVGNSWEHRAYWGASRFLLGIEGTNSRRFLGALPAAGEWVRLEVAASLVGLENAEINGIAFTLFSGRAAWAHTGKSAAGAPPANDVVWVGNAIPPGATAHDDNETWSWIDGRDLSTPFEADYQTRVVNSIRQLTPIQTLKTQLNIQVPSEVGQLDTTGLEPFITLLETKVKTANDRLDFHFLRVQTDIYRIRQRVLGIDEATRLATSPVLAAIAQAGESARATQEQLGSYWQKITASSPASAVALVANATAAESSISESFTPKPSDFLAANPALFTSSVIQPQLTTPAATNINLIGQTTFIDSSVAGAIAQSKDSLIAKTISQQTTFGGAGSFVSRPSFQTDDVLEQAPLIGAAQRTVTIAERLKNPPAVESRQFALANRADVVANLASTANFGIDLSDIDIPNGEGTIGKFGAVNNTLLDQIRRGASTVTDEAGQFSDGIRNLDDTVAALRLAEGRVQNYRAAIALCQQTLSQLKTLRDQTDQRLNVIASELAEARHDVSVARSLLAEEQTRVNGINQRRDRIVQEYVPFLVFHRPRFTEVLLDAPVRPLDPGITESPIPDCLSHDLPTPSELQSFMDALREAPAIWFTRIPRLLDRFDRFDLLFRALQNAQMRAIATPAPLPVAIAASRFSQSLSRVVTTQQQTMFSYRTQIAQLNLSGLNGQSWKRVRDQSESILSIADLLNGSHGRSDVVQQAAQHLDQLARVADCLYIEFGEVLPVIRLDWAERLSQYDAPVNLRSLASLPRWSDIPLLQRRKLQTLVDWLYQQVNALQPGAIALISDLIRVCILLASHAPINQIVSGRLTRPTTVNQGSRVELTVDSNSVRVGMRVFLYSNLNQVVAHGIVEDLGTGQVAARIVQTTSANLALAENTRVQFSQMNRMGQM